MRYSNSGSLISVAIATLHMLSSLPHLVPAPSWVSQDIDVGAPAAEASVKVVYPFGCVVVVLCSEVHTSNAVKYISNVVKYKSTMQWK